MSLSNVLKTIRNQLGHWWIIISFGLIYFLSQIVIGIILEKLGSSDVAKLQILGVDSIYYIHQFQEWKELGLLPFYEAHFILDDIHWLWYAIALSALLAKSMNAAKVSQKYNGFLLLPLIAGLCDSYENHIQHIFLSSQTFSTIIDPLPLLSTSASITKWLLVAITLSFIIFLNFLNIKRNFTQG